MPWRIGKAPDNVLRLAGLTIDETLERMAQFLANLRETADLTRTDKPALIA